jgi:hypothetical protein
MNIPTMRFERSTEIDRGERELSNRFRHATNPHARLWDKPLSLNELSLELDRILADISVVLAMA